MLQVTLSLPWDEPGATMAHAALQKQVPACKALKHLCAVDEHASALCGISPAIQVATNSIAPGQKPTTMSCLCIPLRHLRHACCYTCRSQKIE